MGKLCKVIKNGNGNMSLEQYLDKMVGRLMMADFLAINGLPVKCKRSNPHAPFDGGAYSNAYKRVIESRPTDPKRPEPYIRSATESLMWDAEFLVEHLDTVKASLMASIAPDLKESVREEAIARLEAVILNERKAAIFGRES